MAFGTTPVNGFEYAKYASVPPAKVVDGKWGGDVMLSYDTYNAVALAAGSQINMGFIPAGAIILDGDLYWSALGSNTQILGVGDGVVCNKFMLRANGAVASTTAAGSAASDYARSCGHFNALIQGSTEAVQTAHGIYKGVRGFYCSCDVTVLVSLGYQAAATGTLTCVVRYIKAG